MDMEKPKFNKTSFIASCVVSLLVAIAVDLLLVNYVQNKNSCEIHIDASNVDGSITARIVSSGNPDSCDSIVSNLTSHIKGDQSADDSEAAEADSADDVASAPCAASQ